MSELHDRVERGLAIASSRGQIEEVVDGVWFVKSQTGQGGYLVTGKGGEWTCNCPDFRGSQVPCKHVFSVRFSLKGLTQAEAYGWDAQRPRPTYRQNWPAYREAQRSELRLFDSLLKDVLAEVESPFASKPTGRPRLPFEDLLYCTIQKVYQGLPLGLAHGHNERLRSEGRVAVAPSRNMASILLRAPELTAVLSGLVARTAFPLTGIERDFAADSSGFRTSLRGDYCREKHGARVHNVWQKAHVIVGTTTHAVVGVVITDGHAGDVSQFAELVRQAVEARFNLGDVTADRGYISADNYQAVADAGGVPYILFKENNRGRAGKRGWPNTAWKTMWRRFHDERSEFLEHYHKRENVEAVFSAIKRKLGETLRSRDPVGQVNELLCKIIAYNITVLVHEAFEHGIDLSSAPPGPASEKRAPLAASLARAAPAAPGSNAVWQGGDN